MGDDVFFGKHHPVFKSVVTCPEWNEWVRSRSSREVRDRAIHVRDRILDTRAYEEKDIIVEAILVPITVRLRLGDTDKPKMPYVYGSMLSLFDEINAAVQKHPDVDEGGYFDYGHLTAIEEIIGARWKYLHTPYHSVGYLLNPENMDIDINMHGDEIVAELRADLEAVCTRLFHDAPEKAALALEQYEQYCMPTSRYRSPTRRAAIKLPSFEPHKWWTTYGHDYQQLAFVARRVLSKHISIGSIERSHKKLKSKVFPKGRSKLAVEKVNRETYVNYNLQKLDQLADKAAMQNDYDTWSESYVTNTTPVEASVL